MTTKAKDEKEEDKIVYHFVGDGSQVISDAPSEDITEEAWQQLPKHVQRSIAGSKLYKRGKGDDGSDDEKRKARTVIVARREQPRKEEEKEERKSDNAE